jgi:hypothetical protein
MATLKTTISYGRCSLLASFDMNCPLCKTLVRAGTKHECKGSLKSDSKKPRRAKLKGE